MSSVPANRIPADSPGEAHDTAAAFNQVGDIRVFDGLNWVALPVGEDAQVLTCDSNEALGIKWADLPA